MAGDNAPRFRLSAAPEHNVAGFDGAHVHAADDPGQIALATRLCKRNAILSNDIIELDLAAGGQARAWRSHLLRDFRAAADQLRAKLDLNRTKRGVSLA